MANEKNDYIVCATAANGQVRAYAAVTTQTAEASRKAHLTSPVVTAALGRVLSATLLMGAMNKQDHRLTVQFKGDGPLKGMLATTESRGTVKGYPLIPDVDIPLKPNGKLDVSGALGKGIMSVTIDYGLKEPYNGQVPLYSSEIAEDFAYYFLHSAQTPSAVALGVLVARDLTVAHSGGLILQLMPGADDSLAKTLNERVAQMPPITAQMTDGRMATDWLKSLLTGFDLTILDRFSASYTCNCSKTRMFEALAAIGKDEIADIIQQDKMAELQCHFCNKKYTFDENELKSLIV